VRIVFPDGRTFRIGVRDQDRVRFAVETDHDVQMIEFYGRGSNDAFIGLKIVPRGSAADLVPLVGQVVADVGGGGDAELDAVGVSAGVGGGGADRFDGPLGDLGVGQLEDEAVGLLAAQLEGLGAIGGHVDVQV